MDEMNLNVIEEVDAEVMPDIEISNAGAIAAVVGIGALAIGGIAFAAYKYRHKIEEFRIKQLEKKGYIVSRAAKEDSEEIPEEA